MCFVLKVFNDNVGRVVLNRGFCYCIGKKKCNL